MRTTKPEKGNKYYNTVANGGWSPCIQGKPVDKDCDVLSNCVGYVIGRFHEYGNYGNCNVLKKGHAEDLILNNPKLKVTKQPVKGGVMVWAQGRTKNTGDGPGHTEFVEDVNEEGTEIICSKSDYGGKAFQLKTRTNANGRWGIGGGYTYLGCINHPKGEEEMIYIKMDKGGTNIREQLKFSNGKTSAKKLGLIPKGKSARVLEFISGIQADGYQWIKVEYNGIIGYSQLDSAYNTLYQ